MSDIGEWLEAVEVVKVDDELARSPFSLYLYKRLSSGAASSFEVAGVVAGPP